jgi:hypothetical protein
MKFNFKWIFGLMLFLGCVEKQDEAKNWANHIPFDSNFSISEMESSTSFSLKGEAKGFPEINQASGLAYSRKNPGFLWTHQDKNFDNSLFLINASNGEIVATYKILGTENRDWEDIEIATGPTAGLDYLYLGDIGDNDQIYNNYAIYRFEEPKFEESHQGKIIELEMPYDKITFRYPNKSYDVEALMVDPLTKDIYLATKRELRSQLFVLPFPQNLEKELTAIKAGSFSFRFVTAGTVSKEGDKVIMKNYNQIFYWEKKSGQTFVEMMAEIPLLLPYDPKEEQGEAICFDPAGGYFTLSELANGVRPQLYHYSKN